MGQMEIQEVLQITKKEVENIRVLFNAVFQQEVGIKIF
jgi:hypothetical protein